MWKGLRNLRASYTWTGRLREVIHRYEGSILAQDHAFVPLSLTTAAEDIKRYLKIFAHSHGLRHDHYLLLVTHKQPQHGLIITLKVSMLGIPTGRRLGNAHNALRVTLSVSSRGGFDFFFQAEDGIRYN